MHFRNALALSILAVALLMVTACGSDDEASVDLTAGSPEIAGAIADSKADGAFGATEIHYGDTVTGELVGAAMGLYRLEGERNDEVKVTITRTGGDLRPSAYLYLGTETFVAPTDYDAASSEVVLNYVLGTSGEHYLVAKAYREQGSGAFSMTLECTGGPCAGVVVPDSATEAASECIEAAAACVMETLTGTADVVQARQAFDSCLANQASADLGYACDDTCSDSEVAPVCDGVAAALATIASHGEPCVAVMNTCLDGCYEFGGYYGYDDALEYTMAYTCWYEGHTSSCVEYMSAHLACGGSDYSEAGADGCYGLCESTEGAWDEGPWDGCTEACDDICMATVQECELECGDTDMACQEECIARYNSTYCESYLNY